MTDLTSSAQNINCWAKHAARHLQPEKNEMGEKETSITKNKNKNPKWKECTSFRRSHTILTHTAPYTRKLQIRIWCRSVYMILWFQTVSISPASTLTHSSILCQVLNISFTFEYWFFLTLKPVDLAWLESLGNLTTLSIVDGVEIEERDSCFSQRLEVKCKHPRPGSELGSSISFPPTIIDILCASVYIYMYTHTHTRVNLNIHRLKGRYDVISVVADTCTATPMTELYGPWRELYWKINHNERVLVSQWTFLMIDVFTDSTRLLQSSSNELSTQLSLRVYM